MFEILKKSIYKDPLTGLPNFFNFVESDVCSLFGKSGSIIIYDLIKFTKINEVYGLEAGDFCIKTLSEVISNCLSECENHNIFRTDGDEFTVILPLKRIKDAKTIIENIKIDFKHKMEEQGLSDVDFRTLSIEYNKEIPSITKFYQLIFQETMEKIKENNNEPTEERWLGHIIDSFTRRIKETLSFFNDACVIAMADDISGLPNHRAGKTFLSALIEENKENKEGFSILFIDGDNLRRYNDISYSKGNQMIRELSSIINNSLRKNDKVFRWLTGDEFLVVLPNVDEELAYKLAERTRLAVEEKTKDWIYPVTISIGVAHYTDENCDIENIINQAEKANSFAKNLGKNRVVKWSLTEETYCT